MSREASLFLLLNEVAGIVVMISCDAVLNYVFLEVSRDHLYMTIDVLNVLPSVYSLTGNFEL